MASFVFSCPKTKKRDLRKLKEMRTVLKMDQPDRRQGSVWYGFKKRHPVML
ncbi:hypothetical protein ACFL0H_10855 [Thermodesulfobacteriota bacterium]